MMELIEAAIPMIQHLPQAGPDPSGTPQIAGHGSPGMAIAPADEFDAKARRDAAPTDDQTPADQTALAAHIERTLERLRTQQASLTSGALLQQYQRQVVFEVEDSRPATRVLDVQG